MQTAALGLIRAQDTDSGTELWSAGSVASGSPAGLLCFDEVQITDPFTALILKGASPLHSRPSIALAHRILLSLVCVGTSSMHCCAGCGAPWAISATFSCSILPANRLIKHWQD